MICIMELCIVVLHLYNSHDEESPHIESMRIARRGSGILQNVNKKFFSLISSLDFAMA